MEFSDRWYAYNILQSERLISSFGSLRGLEMPDDVTDDLLATDEPFVDTLFQWYYGRGYSFDKRLQSSTATFSNERNKLVLQAQ